MTTVKQLYQEIKEINKKSVYDNQAHLDFPEGEENPFKIQVTLTPQYGPFKSGKICFMITLPTNYPDSVPSIACNTKVYHPNIAFGGNICFSMLSSDWSKDYRLEHYINGLLYLLANPNHSSPLNSTCVDRNQQLYETNVQLALYGFPIKGVSFAKSTVIDETEIPQTTLLRYLYNCSQQITMLDHIFQNYSDCVKQSKSLSVLAELNIQGFIRRWKNTGMTIHKVKSRAKCTGFSPKRVLKELLWNVDGKNVLIVSNGPDLIDKIELAKELNCKQCNPVQPDTIIDITGWSKQSIPIFGVATKVDDIIVNTTIFDLPSSDELAMASGCTGILLIMMKSEFERMTNHLKVKRMKLPLQVNDGVSPLVEKVEKMSVQPN